MLICHARFTEGFLSADPISRYLDFRGICTITIVSGMLGASSVTRSGTLAAKP